MSKGPYTLEWLEEFVMDTIDHTWGKTNMYTPKGIKALLKYRFDLYRSSGETANE